MISNGRNDEKLQTLSYTVYGEDEQYGYISDFFFNALFLHDKGNSQMKFVGHFMDNALFGEGIIQRIFVQKDKIVFFPLFGKNIYFFSKADEKLNCIENIFCKDGEMYSGALAFENGYLLVPKDLKTEILFLSDENELRPIPILSNNIKKALADYDEAYTDVYGMCELDDRIYISVQNCNVMLEVGKSDYSVSLIDSHNTYSLGNVEILDDIIWITLLQDTANNASVLSFDLKTYAFKEYYLPDAESGHTCYCFARYRDSLLALEYEGDHIWIFDKDMDEWIVFAYKTSYPSEFRRIRDGYPCFFGYYHADGKLLLLPTGGNGIISINEETDELSFFPSRIPIDFMKKRILIERQRRAKLVEDSIRCSSNESIQETTEMDIGDYVECIVNTIGKN